MPVFERFFMKLSTCYPLIPNGAHTAIPTFFIAGLSNVTIGLAAHFNHECLLWRPFKYNGFLRSIFMPKFGDERRLEATFHDAKFNLVRILE
ncbi:MAG: hypothetical protein CMI66_00745 [Pedosphaera sp.]|nr:hypothetical protein [Pedosphaera sp.]HBP57120.1 hypothetical protein [Verrucomicrobiales bacterium]HCP38418.1 hypothetical protein [Verrucomicrobiales bacterium]HCZ04003.1 hypothetical protein [Verrucomicrobiales bacterium]|tara:strand:+ start:1366 stop:1641 length:276 start_codon:yes stop_codon:yes gene_type:complete